MTDIVYPKLSEEEKQPIYQYLLMIKRDHQIENLTSLQNMNWYTIAYNPKGCKLEDKMRINHLIKLKVFRYIDNNLWLSRFFVQTPEFLEIAEKMNAN
ncbi:MAG: hypothetical protein QM489_00640 [Candidatus Izemoplasma sp.]